MYVDQNVGNLGGIFLLLTWNLNEFIGFPFDLDFSQSY